jgi:uncharacterized delta-60 repeat protein
MKTIARHFNRPQTATLAMSFAGAALILLELANHPAYAAAGDLDPGFARTGAALLDFSDTSDYAMAVKVQADGRIVVAGETGVYPLFHSGLARYNANGKLDRSFGTGGKITAALDSRGDLVTAVTFQSDGKILAAGSVIQNNSTLAFVLGRFNLDGTLDQTFGNNGSVEATFGDPSAEGNDVLLQTDGKIIVVGFTGVGSYADNNNFALVRYNPDGTLDQTFGTGGKIVTAFAGSSMATSAVLQSDGRFVVAGTCTSGTHEFCLARYNADGSLDSTFGSFGEVMTKVGTGDAFSFGSVLQADGNIVLSGYSSTSQGHDYTLVRYNSNGTLDTTFGNGGVVATDFSGGTDDIAYALAAQRDGKLVAVGFTGTYPALNFAVARYSSAGQLDQSFGTGGKVITDFGNSDDGYAVTIQSNGRIVAAGAAIRTASTFDFAVARYLDR